MKKIVTIFLLLVSFVVFSQEKKTIPNGYITFNSNSTVYFKNMTIDGEKVAYFVEDSQNQMTYSLSGVKKIVDNYGAVIYDSDKKTETDKKDKVEYVTREKSDEEKLVYKSSTKILLNGKKLSKDELKDTFMVKWSIYNQYKKGKSGADIGAIMMGGGLGLFIGGGLSNLSNSNNGKKGSPALLIAGVAIGVVGIPVRIVGVKKIKRAVKEYNDLSVREVSFFDKSELKIVAGVGTLGLRFQF